jgi:knotted carbamoyltransferase YgeW
MEEINKIVKKLETLNFSDSYQNDFLLTWDKSIDELKAVLLMAEAIRELRENNISTRLYDNGLSISQFRDTSTRTRFSFASASNMLGLEVQDLDEKLSQIIHGETVRETSNMISFMADTIGIRDCMNIGKGHTYMKEVANSVQEGYNDSILDQRPSVLNLQSDIDHPTQSMADAAHLINHFGDIEKLKGKKIAMTWAYSPSYGKPLSVPQGIIGLMTRFGMDVNLSYPEGYGLLPDTLKVAEKNASSSGGSFTVTHSMEGSFEDADIVYPKSWAPFSAMQERTELFEKGKFDAIENLSQRMLTENAKYKNWECTEDLMKTTKNGEALYMHCLPADITGVSCDEGEVVESVFERYRVPLYNEAGYKPYIIAAMMVMGQVPDPAKALRDLTSRATTRKLF